MPFSRRNFLQKAGTLAGAFAFPAFSPSLFSRQLHLANQRYRHLTDDEMAQNEDYWSVVQQGYTVNPNIINLNNGGVSPAPRGVQDALDRYNKYANEAPSYFMWRIMDQGREPLREKLAHLAGTSPHEIAINRNATEALNTVVFGLPLQPGDEVIGTRQDYPNMVQAWQQRALRDGIVYKQIDFSFPIENDDTIVNAFENAITPNTKLLHITHIINWVGQIMPVRKLADMAHKRGIEVLVDGAHSFALLHFAIPDLHCDYFGTSLHKFLSAPIGTGMLWIKKEHIARVWPLLCNSQPQSTDIRKFETLGTRSFAIEQAIGEAINFHNAIGGKRKEARIRYLKNYWAQQAQQIKGVRLHTSLKNEYSCAICGVSIDGMSTAELDGQLFGKYKIHCTNINWENISCVRITPHVYTTLHDLDKLVTALTAIAAKA